MKHEICIMSHRKERDKDGKLAYKIESHFTITEEEILEFAMQLYSDGYDLKEDRIYEASIDQTVI